ncbi:hypothetical protein MUO74_01535, partial [Candidatus Bathyarchaeota archaeon]|nr:hypothetical protein [Candidatus Bathyarchaeota archaeon]
IEDKHLKQQFTVKDQVGSLEMSVENIAGRLDSNPNLSGGRKPHYARLQQTSYLNKFLLGALLAFSEDFAGGRRFKREKCFLLIFWFLRTRFSRLRWSRKSGSLRGIICDFLL